MQAPNLLQRETTQAGRLTPEAVQRWEALVREIEALKARLDALEAG